MYYFKLRYILEDAIRYSYDEILKIFSRIHSGKRNNDCDEPLSDYRAAYRITFAERNSADNTLVKEKIIQDGITDIEQLNYKYQLILNSFREHTSNSVNTTSTDIPKNPDTSYYVEISEVGKEEKKIAFATVLWES